MNRFGWSDYLVCILLLLVAVGMIAGSMVVGYNEFILTLELLGEPEMALEYGSAFVEPGVTADFRGTLLLQEGRTPDVTTEGTVDVSTVGEYVITYTANFGKYTQSKSRVVRIVDTQLPEIYLSTDPAAYTLPGREYEEEGYFAFDDYDGDITALVERVVAEDAVTYRVADSSGNEAQISRTIVYDDPIAPELVLQGEAQMSIYPGTEFADPGFTAVDNCDGDISDKVVVSGEIDIWLPGTYQLEYSVQDSYGNTATAIREVTVQSVRYSKGTNGRVICLTFDDGPSNMTPYLLDVLKKYNVKATFFVVNTGAIEFVQRAAAEGHSVAIHSASHNFGKIYASEEAYFADLYRMQEIIAGYTGKKPMLVRFPGGTSNTISKFNPGIMTRLTQALRERGFQYCDWNVDSKDAAGAKTSEEVFQNVIKGIGKKTYAVVLQHDTQGFSVRAVEKILVWGIVNGYSFQVLTANSGVIQHGVKN